MTGIKTHRLGSKTYVCMLFDTKQIQAQPSQTKPNRTESIWAELKCINSMTSLTNVPLPFDLFKWSFYEIRISSEICQYHTKTIDIGKSVKWLGLTLFSARGYLIDMFRYHSILCLCIVTMRISKWVKPLLIYITWYFKFKIMWKPPFHRIYSIIITQSGLCKQNVSYIQIGVWAERWKKKSGNIKSNRTKQFSISLYNKFDWHAQNTRPNIEQPKSSVMHIQRIKIRLFQRFEFCFVLKMLNFGWKISMLLSFSASSFFAALSSMYNITSFCLWNILFLRYKIILIQNLISSILFGCMSKVK